MVIKLAMPTFVCLYVLENSDQYILEIKRSDLIDTAPAAERFRWMKIDRQNNQTTDLTFRSMDAAGEVEERYFEQGFLKFNKETGTFIEKFNSPQHQLHRIGNEIPKELERIITAYLETKSS